MLLSWDSFLCSPIYLFWAPYNQIIVYSSLAISFLLCGQRGNGMVKRIKTKYDNIPRVDVWSTLLRMRPSRMTFYGIQWGVPREQIQNLLSIRRTAIRRSSGRRHNSRHHGHGHNHHYHHRKHKGALKKNLNKTVIHCDSYLQTLTILEGDSRF